MRSSKRTTKKRVTICDMCGKVKVIARSETVRQGVKWDSFLQAYTEYVTVHKDYCKECLDKMITTQQ